MTYLKCALIGVASGTALAILWIVGCLFLPLILAWQDSGLGASSVDSDSTLLVWLAGFVTGFWISWRRQRMRR